MVIKIAHLSQAVWWFMIDDLLYLAAFRYALGRSTYIVGTICDELLKATLSDETKKTIVREIKEAEVWDSFLLNQPTQAGVFLQSWPWLSFQESLGNRVWRLGVERKSLPGCQRFNAKRVH